MTDTITELVAAGDLDGLIRLVDGLCSAREWDEIVVLRDRCRHALEERGLQLWPAAEYAEYRLALEASPEFAGPVVVEGAGRFALGPLWEVAGMHHRWADLAPHVPNGPARSMAAHERVIRGEDLSGDDGLDHHVLDLPFVLQDWEPRYPPAVYRSDSADFPTPPDAAMAGVAVAPGAEAIDDEESTEALVDLGRVWSTQSNGSVAAIAVEGDALAAIGALDPGPVVAGAAGAADVLAWMTWAGSSGGAYGRRRGTPAGRFAAWWAMAALTGLEWPPDPDELIAAAGAMPWMLWAPRD
ncbi:hypothetical protein HQ535_00110, partial [bacterium]|nr:hypothetical protein [bacterium]